MESKIIKGEVMSASRGGTARTRLSLLAGGSLVVATLMSTTVALLAPTPAMAVNECGDPATNVAAADTFQCNGSYAGISYPTTNGNLILQLQNNVTTTTGGIVVTPTGANTVTINRIADSPADSGDPSITSTSVTTAAIEVVRTTGGAITVNLTDNDTADTPMVISGVAGGVRLQNTGTANTTFTSTNGTITASAGVGLDVSTLSVAGGNVTVTNGSAVTGSTYGIRAATSGTGNVTVTNNGSVIGATGSILIASGANATITNGAAGTLAGQVTMANTGTATFSNNGAWTFAGTSLLGTGDTVFTNSATGVIAASGPGALDFQAGVDRFNNQGVLAAGGTSDAATLTLANLELWNNSGRVLFGANAGRTGSDGVANDRIVTAAIFTGGAGSTLVMDIDLTGAQDSCAAAVSADCLDLRNGAAGGVTSIVVTPVGAGRELGGRIVLVDVSGGSSDDDRFVLDPTSPGYAQGADGKGAIDAGILHYGLYYDAAARQHFLLGAPDSEAFEPGLFSTFVHTAWDVATGTAFERGLDLRDGVEAAGSGGVWMRAAGAWIDDAPTQSFTSEGVTLAYDMGYEQNVASVVGGADLVRASGENGGWVFGVTGGYAASQADFDATASSIDLKGYFLGAYSSFVSGPVFVDAVLNGALFDLEYDTPGYATSGDDGQAASLGLQVEGGWRLNVPDMPAYIEPLAALSYVRTSLDDLAFADIDAAFEDTDNLRAGLGLRVAGEAETEQWTTRFAFTARAWEEFGGDSDVRLTNSMLDLPLAYDDASGQLGEVGFQVDALGLGDRLALNVAARMQFKNDYESRQLSIGARYSW